MTLEETINKCKKGNRKAQKALYELSHRQIMGICIRYCHSKEEAEDIFQECFVKIFNQLEQLNEPEAYWGWMKSLTIRTCLTHFRKKAILKEGMTAACEIENNGYEAIFSQMRLQEIIKVINKLPEGYKLVFNLYEVEGYKHKEIAELLGISIGTSKSQLSKAKTMLSKALQVVNSDHKNLVYDGK